MQSLLRLNEAQVLYDAVNDPLLRPALEAFFKKQRDEHLEEAFGELQIFAQEQLKSSSL